MSIIITKNSITPSNTPSPGTLVTGELAINVVDGKLFYGSGSAVREFLSTINTGSLLTTASFNSYTSSTTAQFAGTASYASQSLSASYAFSSTSASYASSSTSASYATTASYALNAGGTPGGSNTQVQFNANNAFSGSPNFTFNSGSNTLTLTGSLNVSAGITGSLQGTASWANNATTSSFATTASYASNGGVTQILQGSNITVSGNGTGQVTISSTGGGSSYNTATGSYGSFYSTVTQTNVAGTARSMSLNVTDISNGVSISGSIDPFNTYIKTENAGIYNIQFSAQVDKIDSGTDEIWVWLRKNGSNITDSATSLQLVGNGAHYVAAWNFFVNSSANDYYQLMWYSPDANVRLHAEAGFGVVPGIPSLIVTVNRVDQFLSNTGSFSGSFTGVFTGSLQGTASWATNFVSATNYVLNSATSSFATTESNTFTGLQVAKSGISGFAHRTTDYVAASTGTSLFTSLGAATGDTYGVINVRTAGGLSSGVLALNTGGGAVTIGKTVTLANATLDISGNTVMTGSLTVTAGITGTLTGTATTASSVSTLNQNVLITGSLTVGSGSAGASENTITLGARDTGGKGGQIGFNASGDIYTSASFLDNYQNRFRLLKGNNTISQAEVARFNLTTNQFVLPSYTSTTSFTGTSTSILGTTSGGEVITMGGWTDYLTSSTIVGATSTTGVINYMIMGKMMFLQVYITGTSTATNWTFTIPASASATLQASVGSAINNNTTPGLCVAFVNSSTNVISLSFAATGNASGTVSQGWSATNTKVAKFNMTLNIV